MKHPFYVFCAVVAAASFASCGSGGAGASDSDSVKAAEKADTLAMQTPDLAWKDLSGNVESCVLEYYDMSAPKDISADSVAFTPEGNVASMVSYSVWDGRKASTLDVSFLRDSGGKELPAADRASEEGLVVSLERDGDGRIVSFSRNRPDGDYTESAYTEYYTWDEDGRPASFEINGAEWTTRVKYEYGADGRLAKSVAVSSEYDYEATDTQTYVYKAEDARGNWTEREVSVVSEQDDEGRKTTTRSLRVERRRIRYRP